MNFVLKFLVTLPIKIYKLLISPFLGSNCRFTPTCSQYMQISIEKYGIKGVGLGIIRILKCHPWGKSGYDPVP